MRALPFISLALLVALPAFAQQQMQTTVNDLQGHPHTANLYFNGQPQFVQVAAHPPACSITHWHAANGLFITTNDVYPNGRPVTIDDPESSIGDACGFGALVFTPVIIGGGGGGGNGGNGGNPGSGLGGSAGLLSGSGPDIGSIADLERYDWSHAGIQLGTDLPTPSFAWHAAQWGGDWILGPDFPPTENVDISGGRMGLLDLEERSRLYMLNLVDPRSVEAPVLPPGEVFTPPATGVKGLTDLEIM